MLGRITRYNISESFNVVRWMIAIITFAFVAVVSLAKYVNLAGITAITFSSVETLYLILNDPTSIAYIYLPIYLFLICGLMFDDNFGSLEVIKSGSRGRWLLSKYLTLLFYTGVFFIFLIGLNFMISNQVFPYSDKWSSDFIKVQVIMGQSPANFSMTPLVTIGLSIASVFFMYLCIGTLSLVISLYTNREVDALFFSLLTGIGVSMLFVFGLELTREMSAQAFMFRNMILITSTLILIGVASHHVKYRDFNLSKRQ